MEHLIDDLLDATAIEAGTMRLRLAPFVIDDLVQEVVEQLMLVHPTHRLLIEETEATSVNADRERTRQVLTNLLPMSPNMVQKQNLFRCAPRSRKTQ